MFHRIHVIKVPTTRGDLFPYSHYADQGHDPMLEVLFDHELCLTCTDLFKLKPNIQSYPKDRIDIYVPYSAAASISDEIASYFGLGQLAHRSATSPEAFRQGSQTLPLIGGSRFIPYSWARVEIAGYTVTKNDPLQKQRVYIDQEWPNEGHIEMKGPEVHLGVDLKNCSFQGGLDYALIREFVVPERELRTGGEKNPINKAVGTVTIAFDRNNARALAATLRHYASLEK